MTKTEETNAATNEKVHSEKNVFWKKNMQNSILKQAKVVKQGADYMEQAA